MKKWRLSCEIRQLSFNLWNIQDTNHMNLKIFNFGTNSFNFETKMEQKKLKMWLINGKNSGTKIKIKIKKNPAFDILQKLWCEIYQMPFNSWNIKDTNRLDLKICNSGTNGYFSNTELKKILRFCYSVMLKKSKSRCEICQKPWNLWTIQDTNRVDLNIFNEDNSGTYIKIKIKNSDFCSLQKSWCQMPQNL